MAMKTDERTEVEGIERRKRSGVLEKDPGDSAVFETKGGNQADHQLPEYALGLAELPPHLPSRFVCKSRIRHSSPPALKRGSNLACSLSRRHGWNRRRPYYGSMTRSSNALA